ncbi:MAG TPA: hypothetical protein VFT59_02375 [Candidatus Saccharimonadales bacterium]|nr:hypothetical protein [Candidatus Saccharimonadales bacterium]
MSIFDDIKAKAEEFMAGAPEEINNQVEDATGGLTDVTQQAQDILPDNQEEK